MDWGSRYLLTALPVLALLSARNLERVGKDVRMAYDVRLFAMFLLVLASGLSQWKGWQAIEADLAFSRNTAQVVRSLPSEAVVSDVWWLGPELTLAAVGKQQFLLRPTADTEPFVQVVHTLRLREFCYLGSVEGAERLSRPVRSASPPFRIGHTWKEGGWVATLFSQK
jgi:hypothetical protein